MSEAWQWWILSLVGFLLSSIGGLGGELLDRFAGRSLEAYCRLKKNRDRFGAVLDHQDATIRGSEYLRMIGTVVFLISGTSAIFVQADLVQADQPISKLLLWAIAASGLMMLIHIWLPVVVTRFASTRVLYHTWSFWRALSVLMSPLSAPGQLMEIIGRRLTGNQESDSEDEEQLEDEIRTIVTAGTRGGHFGPGVREMIQGVMTLHEDTVGHIMTPRGDVDAIDVTWNWDKVLETIIGAGRTRFPVYEGTLDTVVGVLYVKDLLPFLELGSAPDKPLTEIIRHAWTVPVDRSVELILREFLHNRSHMAIVLDEFQQTAGVVTIEDALEEIVGEIVDESDQDEEFGIEIIDETTVEVDGRVMIDDLNDSIAWEIPESDDYETVAGYVLFHNGAIPEEGDQFSIGDAEFEILKANNRKIDSMRIRHTPQQDQKAG